jgi:hypothetical protein
VPIDFAAVVEPFRDPISRESKAMVLLFTRMGPHVERLARKAEEAERATRDLPVLEFVGDALGVRVVVPPGERVTLGADGLVAGLVAGGPSPSAPSGR